MTGPHIHRPEQLVDDRILRMLRSGPLPISVIRTRLGLSKTNVNKQLARLEAAGRVRRIGAASATVWSCA